MKIVAPRWLNLFGSFSRPCRQQPPLCRRRSTIRLSIEQLEHRLTPSGNISTVAGNGSSGYSGDGGPATLAKLYNAYATAVDSSGNVYIADTNNDRIREVVASTGNIITVAGNGTVGYSGDNGPATSAAIDYPFAVAVDSSGNIYIADSFNNRIREVVKSTGNIITIAGNGTGGFTGDGGPATSAEINFPEGVAVDSSGNVFFSDESNQRVREIVKSTGVIITVAGNGTWGYNGDGELATSAELYYPKNVAVDASGDLFIADWYNNRIREVVKSTGDIATVAGTGTGSYNGDGIAATSAMVNHPTGVAVDSSGNIYIGDTYNSRIREVTKATGIITTIAGNGTAGYNGDGGPATSAELYDPYGLALDNSANVYVADSFNYRIREFPTYVAPTLGSLSSTGWTVNQAGYTGLITASNGTAPYSNLTATGLPAGLTASLSGSTVTISGTPTAAGTFNNVNISVQDSVGTTASHTYTITINAAPTLGSLSPTQVYASAWGYPGAIPISGGTGPFLVTAQANLPPGLTATATGTSITFTGIPTTTGTFNNIQLTVRDMAGASASGVSTITIALPPAGSIITFAGNGTSGYSGDGGIPIAAKLDFPHSVAVDSSGNVYIADTNNNRVREVVKSTGIISTIAGTGTVGYSGDGGAATSAKLNGPYGVAVDSGGNVYIADAGNNRIREVVKSTGIITTIAGNGTAGYTGDGGAATSAELFSPQGVYVDAGGNVYIADLANNRIREVTHATGNITTIAGNGTTGPGGDAGAPTSASLNDAYGVAVDATGDVFIADAYNSRVREIPAPPAPLALGTLSAPAWDVNQAYSGTITVSGGVSPYNSLSVSGLPAGLSAALSGSTITISGTPTATGIFSSVVVSVHDSGSNSVSGTFSITINPTLALGTLSATQWTVNRSGFSPSIIITGGTGAYNNASYSGLPAGLYALLNGSTITIGGTPTQAGSANVTFNVRDGIGIWTSRTYSMTINAAPALGTLSNAAWTVNQAGYSGSIAITSGTSAFSNLTVSGLPAGLSAALSGTTITVSGTPTATGTYSSVNVSVTDAAGATASRTFTITINAVQTLGALSRTQWTVNQAGFSGTIVVTGGTGGYSSLTYSGLPAGLIASLSGSVITVSGTPTATGTSSNISISVKDSTGAVASHTYAMTINAPPTLNTLSIPQWTVNQPGYTGIIGILNGTNPFSLVSVSGLPAGLSAAVNGASIMITGTPTATGTSSSVNISVKDTASASTSRTYSMTINPPPTLGGITRSTWDVGRAGFSGSISVTGGSGILTLVGQANLPPGLTAVLSGSSITFSGTPTTTGVYSSISLAVQDSAGAITTHTYTIVINALPTLGTVLSSSAWTVNAPGFYSVLMINGGSSQYTLNVTGAPAGLYVGVGGNMITFGGTPTVVGVYNNINVSITDASGATASGTYAITINAAPTFGSLSNIAWTVGQAGYSGNINISGGTPYFSNLTVSGLPAGLTAAQTGYTTVTISGTPTAIGTFNNINVTMTDGAHATVSGTFSITINAAPTLGSTSIAAWTVNQSGYSDSIAISGGTGAFCNLTVSGLPAGLGATLSGTTIALSGTPTATGTFSNIGVSVTDATGAVAGGSYAITINPAPTLGSTSIAAWSVNQSGYSDSIAISGGTGAFSNLTVNGLPAGLSATLSGTTITLSGTPTSIGVFNNISVSVTDAAGATASGTYSLTINSAPSLGSLTTSQWTVDQASYTGFIPLSGGTGTLVLSAQANLPPGLTAVVTGSSVTFIGTPSSVGTFNNVQLTVQDATGASSTSTFSITINPGLISTIAGNGTAGYSGDGGTATSAQLNGPAGVSADANGDLFIADTANNCIREVVQATGNIITVAGTGVAGYSGDGAAATAAQLNAPSDVVVDADGDLFIADTGNHCIREAVHATGYIITVAGNGTAGNSGDGAAATAAQLNTPRGVAVDANGNLFIADTGNNAVREVVQATGYIVTVAGTGAGGYSGDGGPAANAQLNAPSGVTVDASGNLFIADTGNNCIREVVQATGYIITVAGTGTAGYQGDGGAATNAQLNGPVSVAVDAAGNLFIADAGNNAVREVVQATGYIVTVAGIGAAGYSGDGGLATSAQLNSPDGLAVDANGDLIIADTMNDCIRKVH